MHHDDFTSFFPIQLHDHVNLCIKTSGKLQIDSVVKTCTDFSSATEEHLIESIFSFNCLWGISKNGMSIVRAFEKRMPTSMQWAFCFLKCSAIWFFSVICARYNVKQIKKLKSTASLYTW